MAKKVQQPKTMGRPSDYDGEKTCAIAREYIQSCIDKETTFHRTRGKTSNSYDRIIQANFPTIEGLALKLNIARRTIYEWADRYPDFNHMVEWLQSKQAEMILKNSASGNYNPMIAKLILSKHGYKESQEVDVTSKGEKVVGFTYVAPEEQK